MNSFFKKAKAVMIGHAIADALGVPVEFRSREYLDKNPVVDMLEYGTHSVPKGTWSDDTSMALCALESISKGKLDYDDIMNNFCKWYYNNEYTATGTTFDIGNTCRDAVDNYFVYKLPYDKCGIRDDYSNGNGSLMRIHPITLLQFRSANRYKNLFNDTISINKIRTASALTHAHPRSRLACIIYSFILWELLKKPDKESIKIGLKIAIDAYDYWNRDDVRKSLIDVDDYDAERAELQAFNRLFDGIEKLDRAEIKSGGYVVDTLEAAVWCLLTTESFKECVLKAVNLGRDTDTTAAVAGGLAGALYGYDNIPKEWLKALLKRDYIEDLCKKTYKHVK